jgi:hypothetical protein
MRSRLTGQAAYCRERAAACAIRAKHVSNAGQRSELLEMANHWLKLADSYSFAEQVSGFLQWDAQRLKPPEAA